MFKLKLLTIYTGLLVTDTYMCISLNLTGVGFCKFKAVMKSCLRLNLNFLLSQFDDIDYCFPWTPKIVGTIATATSTVLDKSGHIILE